MSALIAASLVFLGLHLVVAGTRLRDAITGAIGERAYLGLFALASLGGIVWMVAAYNAAFPGPENYVVYDLGAGVRHLGVPVLAIAFLLGIPGLFLPNPTAALSEDTIGRADLVKGVIAITRHPFLWGVAIWAGFHLAANGDAASIVFFGAFLLLALAGTASIDAKRRRKLGERWTDFAAKTSNVPFVAVLGGRARLAAIELFDWRMAIAAAAFLGVLFAHAWVFSASPFPTGWVPF